MKNKFRINTGTVKIEVNDQGEYIELLFGDQSFPKRVFDLMQNFEEKREEVIEEFGFDDITPGEAVEKNLEIHTFFRDEIDKVFGPETCRKVFGNIIPSVEMLAQFFECLEPYFEDFRKKQVQKNTKYNAQRLGNV